MGLNESIAHERKVIATVDKRDINKYSNIETLIREILSEVR